MRPMGENEVRALYDTLITAWNDHDGTAMAAPFAEDGVVIGFVILRAIAGLVPPGQTAIRPETNSPTRPEAHLRRPSDVGLDVDPGLLALLGGDRRWGVGEWIDAATGLRERDHVADRVGS